MESLNVNMEEQLYLASEEQTEKESVSYGVESQKPGDELGGGGGVKQKPIPIREMLESRDENRKVFCMSDGTEQTVIFPGAVHMYDEKAKEFVTADNMLTMEEDNLHYCNRKGIFMAQFSNEEDNDVLFAVSQGMYRVVVSTKRKGKKRNKGIRPILRRTQNNETQGTDTLVYENVEAGADIEYSVLPGGIKENILIKEKTAVCRYPFVLHCENVTVRFDEANRRVAFLSNETGEEVFYIPAPFMKDADGNVSTAVFYEIKTASDGDVQLTITADSCWVNAEGRSFPVTIDPQILLSGSSLTTYSWKAGNMYADACHEVGATDNGDGSCSIRRMYLSLQMPSLPVNARVKKAELTFYQQSGANVYCDCPKFGLYQVTGPVQTGGNTPEHDSVLIDFDRMQIGQCTDRNTVAYSFDVTQLFDKLVAGETASHNLVLKALDEGAACKNSITLYGSTNSAYLPRISFTYEKNYGVNTSHRAHTHELGRFGQASIDLACGNLMFASDDFAWGGIRMPVTIRHLFTSALAGYQYTKNDAIQLTTACFDEMKLGYGFRLNLMQSMTYLETLPIAWTDEELHNDSVQKDGYVYIGENGEEVYFKQSVTQFAFDENNQCYYLYEEVDGEGVYDPEKRTLSQSGESRLFDSEGRLIRITDEHENHMDITYTSGRISSVTDGAGREFGFVYNSEGFLTAIIAPDGNDSRIEYTYTDCLLTGITYPDGRKAEISWSDNKPSSVTFFKAAGAPAYKVEYAFTGMRVTRVTEYGVEDNAFVLGNSSAYSYSAASNRTIVETTEQPDQDLGESESTTIKTVYSFDDEGNVISEYVYSEEMGSMGVESGGSGIHPHCGEDGAGVKSNINNLLVSHNFESLEGWAEMPGNCDVFGVSSYAYEASTKYGRKLLKMQSCFNCTENGIFQLTNILPAGEYTFSAYVRVVYPFSGTDTPGAYIRVCDTSDHVLAISERLQAQDAEYVRLVAPFVLPEAQSVKVQILLDGQGTVYADAAQLENNPYANAYNMLSGGNFENGIHGWSNITESNISTDTMFNMSKSMCLVGTLEAERYACQTVAVRTNRSTRETFTLSGWAKGSGVVNRKRNGVNDAQFRLRAVVKYNDSTYGEYGTETFTADFAPCTEDWQFASVQFSKSKYRTVEYVKVYCDYGYNIGTAYFDDIQLVRDSLETHLSASDFVVESTGGYEETPADETEDVSATAFEEAMDEWGNALTETTFTDGEFGTIYRSFGYSTGEDDPETAGNDLIRETDARGNNTTYTVDELTSRNEKITDRCGNMTVYEYDAAGRTTKVTSKDANGTELANVSYAYDAFDNLTEIARGDGMKYTLDYNAFHNLQSIGIQGKAEALVTYAYKNGNGRLKSVTYANGHTMKASYNSVGQMVAEKWYDASGALTAHYKYTYDDQGSIVRSIDLTAGKEYNYTYEEGKLVRAAEFAITLGENEVITAKELTNSIRYTYDSEGNLAQKRVIFADGGENTVYYETSDGNTVVKFAAGGRTVTAHSKSDSFGRKVFDELQLGTGFLSRQFAYHVGDQTPEHEDAGKLKSSATTQLVSRITYFGGRTTDYEYDAEERITRVTDSVDGVTEYTYDAMGQLLTETVNGEVVNTMTYDGYGNIVSKNGVVYTYGDPIWKDRLTACNGEAITYDAQGNPVNYCGRTMVWDKGRQLKSTWNKNQTVHVAYTYNANGIRTSKMINGMVYTYTLDGTKILREDRGSSDILIPLYDNEDSVCGLTLDGTPYYFQKNLQGDVIAITDANGDIVARYSYDAWGKCTVTLDTSGTGIANKNPFRYRGYYYDSEIGMYYLQSRYYDPETGRFINADSYISTGQVSLDNNMFAYCGNSSTTKVDYSGTVATLIACAVYAIVNLSHRKYNESLRISGYIYNQFRGTASQYWFGFFRSSHNGCGWIATYNATIMLGKRIDPSKIISSYELWGAVLFGAAGIQPYAIEWFFRWRGYKVTMTYDAAKFDKVAKKNTANIIWYWHKSGAHFVALRWDGAKFIGYNTFKNSTRADDWGTSILRFLKSQKFSAPLMISIS